MKEFSLFTTSGAGLEGVVAKELRDMGYDTHTDNMRVFFKGTLKDIAHTNLWLRTADRVKINFGQFKATDFETLYDETYALPWEDILPLDAEFPVTGRSVRSQLSSVPAAQGIVKKAIAQKIMDTYFRRNHLPETGNLYPIEVGILNNQVTLSIDTTGESLFKRGYREEKGGAPLKENMAAALIKLTTWFPDRPLYDPTCGSGTIPIEAALIGHNIAPGLFREFVAEKWDLFNAAIWEEERQLAREAINEDVELDILATDIDGSVIELAKENAKKAGVADSIAFKQMQLSDYVTDKEFGILISNPPYGDRLLDEEQVHEIYRDMGRIYQAMPTWSKYILTSAEDFEKYYGQKATRKRKLYNGPLRVDYYQYWAERRPRQKD